jgi:hypothetical protein
VKARGFSASSLLYNGPPGIYVPDIKTATNNRKSIFATYATHIDLRIINGAFNWPKDRGELVWGKLVALRKRSIK